MFSKKILLATSGLAVLLFITADFIGTDELCGGREYTSCMQNVHSFLMLLVPILPLFLFSVVTYWMRQEIYVAWFKFARIWIPFSILAIFLAPEYSSDWMYQIEKGTVAAGMSIIFILVSLAIIAYGYLRPSKK